MSVVIRVRDFQALGTAEIVADGLTVVVGPSDRGKSALLRAIEAGLFNRSGEGFVRVGQTSARVALTFNGDGSDHEVVWEKGGGKNQFRVDGADYSRVGRDAPPVLKALGFRDEVIGARVKDDGKLDGGEMMRPQVARQFDPIFLLDQPGSFINEVMVKLSRLSVLQRANRACSTNLRSAKGQFQFQQQAAQRARETEEALRPVVRLRQQVEALCEWAEELGRVAQTIATLKALLVRRKAVAAVATATVPVVDRGPLMRVQQDGLRAVSLRVLVSQRTTYQRRLAPLPGITRYAKSWWKQADSLAPLKGLLTDRGGSPPGPARSRRSGSRSRRRSRRGC